MHDLGLGSLVRLRSGGPLMTAVEFPTRGTEMTGMVVRAWVSADGMPQREAYTAIALELLVSEDRLRNAERFSRYMRDAAATVDAERAN